VTIYDAGWITRTALALSGANVSAAGNPYLFTGRQFDPESGNYYYRARVYSPALGRFMSMDPLGFEAGDYNLYRYVENNPLRFVDPTGHAQYGGDDYDEGDEFYERDELRPDEFPEFSDEQWAAIEYWAESFGLPVEFLAAVIAAEIVWDTDWYDKPIDFGENWILDELAVCWMGCIVAYFIKIQLKRKRHGRVVSGPGEPV
jgi:RHS repeat-associated protein